MVKFMNSILKDKKRFAEIAFTLVLAIVFNQTAYYVGRIIAGSWYHYDMTTAFDNRVPLVPWTVVIYFGCYLFWAANYYICAKQEKEARDRFFTADAISKVICLIFFILLPTTNIRPEIGDATFWDYAMKFLYWIDSPDNLFPSIHCLVSWFCWIGVRRRKDVHIAYRYFSLLMALAVCVSTLTTKQHVVADVISAIALAEICYLIAKSTKINRFYSLLINRLLRLFRI